MKRLAAVLALASTFALPALAQTKWDLPTAYPANNFHTENIQQFANDIDKATGGKLKIQIHPNASLFKAPEIKRAVQGGQAQAGEILLVNFENEDPLFGIDGVPFLASSYAESMKLYKAERKALEEKLAKQGIMLLYAVPWPPQGIYTKKPLESASDLQGVKFRSYNAATARISELMGAVPVQIEEAELSQALATGVADSFISSGSTGYDRKVWEHMTHWYDVAAWLPRNTVFVNKDAWEALDAATQQALGDCAAQAEKAGTAESERLNNWYKEQLAANGMTVQPPGDKLRADLEKIGATMTDEWLEATGEIGKKIVDAYKAM